jgi:hypothetical protein
MAASRTHPGPVQALRLRDATSLAASLTPGRRYEASSFARLPADRFPLITAHATELVAGDVNQRFRFAIDVVFEGVLARVRQ